MYKKFLLFLLFFLTSCGYYTDFAQKNMVADYEIYNIVASIDESLEIPEAPEPPEPIDPLKPTDIINPGPTVNLPDLHGSQLGLLQTTLITLSNGKAIAINMPEAILDGAPMNMAQFQIRKTGDLIYKGLFYEKQYMARIGILKDIEEETIRPVIILDGGQRATSIPHASQWLGQFYGEFQADIYSYEVFGSSQAYINIAQDRIDGDVNYLFARPAEVVTPPTPLEGRIFFTGAIKNAAWNGSAYTAQFHNPETAQPIDFSSGITEGVFLSSTADQEASEAVGSIILTNPDGYALIGSLNLLPQQ